MKDPVQRAAEEFLEECDAFWRRKHGRVLPMIAHYSQRKNLVVAVRVHEYAPDNRWPLFLWDAPFEEPDSYFDGLRAAVEEQYHLIREGVAEEGVTLGALETGDPLDSSALSPMHRAALCVRRVAMLLSDLLDGVLVALVPEQFADRNIWRNTVEAWASLPWPDNVRLAVFDAPGGPLGGILGRKGAHFVVDEGILDDYVRNLCPSKRDSGNGGNSGNGPPPPVLAGNGVNGVCTNGASTLVLPDQAATESGTNGIRTLILHDQPAFEGSGTNSVRTLVLHDQPVSEGGGTNGVETLVLHDRPIASVLPFARNVPTPVPHAPQTWENTGRNLRALMVDAALKSREGEHFAAAQLLQQARTICQVEGLTVQEAIVTIALAAACLAAEQADLAVKAFAMAADLGHRSGDGTVTAHAWLGAGGVYAIGKQHELAARAYEAAGKTAERAESPVLQLEALRLLGACHLAAGAEDKAATAWHAAVRLGAVQSNDVRNASTVRQATRALSDLLARRGLAHVAALA